MCGSSGSATVLVFLQLFFNWRIVNRAHMYQRNEQLSQIHVQIPVNVCARVSSRNLGSGCTSLKPSQKAEIEQETRRCRVDGDQEGLGYRRDCHRSEPLFVCTGPNVCLATEVKPWQGRLCSHSPGL